MVSFRSFFVCVCVWGWVWVGGGGWGGVGCLIMVNFTWCVSQEINHPKSKKGPNI